MNEVSLIHNFLVNLPVAVVAIHWNDKIPAVEFKNDLAIQLFQDDKTVEIFQHIFHIDGLPELQYRKIIHGKYYDVSRKKLGEYEIFTITDTNELVPKEDLEEALMNSRNDPLTGLLNRSGINHALIDLQERLKNQKKAVHRANDNGKKKNIYDKSVAVCMLDLDHFKLVNDTYGHETGDHVLCSLSKIIKHCTRPNDILGRDGGDEFRIILEVSSIEEATIIVNRIVEKMAAVQFGNNDKCTVSAGIVLLPPQEVSIEKIDEARKIADKAMYESKEGGRNKVTII